MTRRKMNHPISWLEYDSTYLPNVGETVSTMTLIVEAVPDIL